MADKTVLVGTNVQFQDTSNEIGATYSWNFGGAEGTSTLQNPTHQYNTIGLYNISHSVTNSCGTTNCNPKTLEVVNTLPTQKSNIGLIIMAAGALGLMLLGRKK